MGKYRNDNYLKKMIIEQSRHLFIYGYNNEIRRQFLKDLEKEYPLVFDSNNPIALYFDLLGLEKNNDNNPNDKMINFISNQYLYFTIATKILEKSMEYDSKLLDTKLSRLIELINRGKNHEYKNIESSKELLKQLKKSEEFYYENYININNGTINKIDITDISIPFIQIEMFIKQYKEDLNIDSYFCILFDKHYPLTVSSTKSINNLIGSRINKDISIKVAVDPNDWDTYMNTNGQLIEVVHDYGTVELDNSYKEYIKRLKK